MNPPFAKSSQPVRLPGPRRGVGPGGVLDLARAAAALAPRPGGVVRWGAERASGYEGRRCVHLHMYIRGGMMYMYMQTYAYKLYIYINTYIYIHIYMYTCVSGAGSSQPLSDFSPREPPGGALCTPYVKHSLRWKGT